MPYEEDLKAYWHEIPYEEDLKALLGMRCHVKTTWRLYLACDAIWRGPEGFTRHAMPYKENLKALPGMWCQYEEDLKALPGMWWRMKRTWRVYLACDAVWRGPEGFTWHVMPNKEDLKALPGMRCCVKTTCFVLVSVHQHYSVEFRSICWRTHNVHLKQKCRNYFYKKTVEVKHKSNINYDLQKFLHFYVTVTRKREKGPYHNFPFITFF